MSHSIDENVAARETSPSQGQAAAGMLGLSFSATILIPGMPFPSEVGSYFSRFLVWKEHIATSFLSERARLQTAHDIWCKQTVN